MCVEKLYGNPNCKRCKGKGIIYDDPEFFYACESCEDWLEEQKTFLKGEQNYE